MKKMQCKDIPDLPILEWLYERQLTGKGWSNWFNLEGSENYCGDAMPAGIPPKLVLNKMRQLLKRKLIEGCGCGCRGDFEINEKGIEYLLKHKSND